MARDEDFYAQAMDEYENSAIDYNLKVKATVLAKGDLEVAKFEYVKLRVEQLKNDDRKAIPLKVASWQHKPASPMRFAARRRP